MACIKDRKKLKNVNTKILNTKGFIHPALVAEWSKALSQIQVERMPQAQIPTRDYDIDCSEVEILCH